MSQLQTQILHQDYLLTCPNGQEAQLLEAVERVDQQFKQMRDSTKLRSRERICVLLSVNLAFENLELRRQLQTLQQQLNASQSSAESSLSESDAERLQVLEAQAAHDQALALHLQSRLDLALSDQASAGASGALPTDTTSSTNLDNAAQVDLPPTMIESL